MTVPGNGGSVPRMKVPLLVSTVALTAVLAACATVAGCGTPTADAGDLAEQVRQKVAARISVAGATVEDVSCDRELVPTRGSAATCTFGVVLDGVASRNVGRATVTDVDTADESLEFFMKPVSWAAPAQWIAQAVAPLVQSRVDTQSPGGTVDRITCARDLSTTSTATTPCMAIWADADGTTYRTALVVTVDRGGDVSVRAAD